MRLALAALLVALALPAAAQSQYSEDRGAFLTFDEFRLERQGPSTSVGGRLSAGWRFGNGADVALRGGYGAAGLGLDDVDVRTWSLGVTSGYTVRPAARTVARVQGSATYHRGTGTSTGTERPSWNYDLSTVTTDVSATVGYQVPLVGSFRLQPTVGAFGSSDVLLSRDTEGFTGALREPGDWRAGLGLQVETPLTFRLLGTDAALVPVLRHSVVGDVPVLSGTFDFRLNF